MSVWFPRLLLRIAQSKRKIALLWFFHMPSFCIISFCFSQEHVLKKLNFWHKVITYYRIYRWCWSIHLKSVANEQLNHSRWICLWTRLICSEPFVFTYAGHAHSSPGCIVYLASLPEMLTCPASSQSSHRAPTDPSRRLSYSDQRSFGGGFGVGLVMGLARS